MLRYLTGEKRALPPRLYEELSAALQDGGQQALFVLVPEQYTLEAERELMDALNLPGSFRLQVLSPGRLCRLVFEQAGYPQPVRIDDRGRVMLLHDALRSLGDELTWYRGAQHRKGFTELAAAQIKEFKQAGQTPEGLMQLAGEQADGALSHKLRDLSRIWAVYEQALSGRFMDGEDEVLRSVERMPQAHSLINCRVWAYGFELISQTLGQLLCGLCRVAQEVTLLLTLTREDAPDSYIYQPVRDSLMHLDRLAGRLHIERQRVYLDAPPACGMQRDILHLHSQLYAYPCLPYEGLPGHVRLMLCRDPMQEAMAALAFARRLCRERGWRYREIAIAGVNLNGYHQALLRAAEIYRIELFLPENRSAERHPLSQYLLCSLRLIARGWQEEEMKQLMRTGYSPLTADEADLLCNYATVWNLHGRAWQRPLTQGDIEQIEPLRERLTAPLMQLEQDFQAAGGEPQAQLTALWRLLENSGAYQKLQEEQQRLNALREFSAANESAQVWNRIVGTLDQLHALLGNSRLSAGDLHELLSQSLAASEIKPLPQSGDALVVGALNRLRGHNLKAVIFLGCSGADNASENGLFLPAERQALQAQNSLWLSPDAFSRSRLGALDLKTVLSMAQEEVLFLYPQSTMEGTAVPPGALVGWIRRALPQVSVLGGMTREEELSDWLYEAPDAALLALPAKLSAHELNRTDAMALGALGKLADCRQALDGLSHALHHRVVSAPLPEKLARKLYNGPQKVSVTRLETFAACPFKHFAQYGLRPEKVEPRTLDARNEGTFFHEALERFLRQASLPVTEDLLQDSMDRMDQVTEGLMAQLMESALDEDPILRARARRLRGIARRAARTAAKHLLGSRFEPLAFEVDFGRGQEILLKTRRGDVPVEGRIDRVDQWKDGQHAYLRVIDYKSGGNEINLVKLYWGLQLQLMIYLAAALEKHRGDAAGVFYFHVQDPTLRTDERNPDSVEMAREKELRLSGLFLNDPDVLRAMAPDFEKSIRLSVNKDGSVKKSDHALQEEDFSALVDYAIEAATALTGQILAGKTDIAPVKIGGSFDACRYCEYADLCQQDERVGPVARVRPSMTAKEAMEEIRRSLGREKPSQS